MEMHDSTPGINICNWISHLDVYTRTGRARAAIGSPPGVIRAARPCMFRVSVKKQVYCQVDFFSHTANSLACRDPITAQAPLTFYKKRTRGANVNFQIEITCLIRGANGPVICIKQ